MEKKLGFRTTSTSRPRILAQLQTIVLEEIDKIPDKDTLKEMLTFIKNEKGRPEAQEGYHDDLVMGLAIAYDIREQQTFNLLPPTEEHRPKELSFESTFEIKESSGDFGSRIEII